MRHSPPPIPFSLLSNPLFSHPKKFKILVSLLPQIIFSLCAEDEPSPISIGTPTPFPTYPNTQKLSFLFPAQTLPVPHPPFHQPGFATERQEEREWADNPEKLFFFLESFLGRGTTCDQKGVRGRGRGRGRRKTYSAAQLRRAGWN